MERTLDDSDEGKRVVDTRGEKMGVVKSVREGTAYVDPDPGITDQIKSKLGWEEPDRGDYPLDENRIEEVTDDEIRVSNVEMSQ